MAIKQYFSWWWLPLFSGIVWVGMLLAMLLYWIVGTNSERYPTIDAGMSLAYISDIGAQELKPLFIAGCAVAALTLDMSFAAERWLRHRGRLVPNQSRGEKILVALTIIFAIVGTVGLVCLAIFDTWRHPELHDLFLLFFMAGYLLSAVFTCWEYQRLGIKNRDYPVLRYSFWIKLVFILVELALAIAFGVTMFTNRDNISAYLEWVIAFVFTGYIFSFIIDLWPAVRTKRHSMRYSKGAAPRAMEEASDGSLPTNTAYTGTNANF